jgi:hypothetical protein
MDYKPFTISFEMKPGLQEDLFGNGFTNIRKLVVKIIIDLLRKISLQKFC